MKHYIVYLIALTFLFNACEKNHKNKKAALELSLDQPIEDIYINNVSYKDSLKANTLHYPLEKNKRFYSIFLIFDANGQKRKSIEVYTTPKESLEIVLKDGAFSFSGKYKKENEFFEKYNTSFSSVIRDSRIHQKEETSFLSFLDSLRSGAYQLLEKHRSTLDSKFTALVEKDIMYKVAYRKGEHENLHKYFSKNKNYKVSDSFYDYRKSVLLDDENAFYLPSFLWYFYSIVLFNQEGGFNPIGQVFKNIDKNIKSLPIRLKFKEESLFSYLQYNGLNDDETQKCYDEYINTPGAKVDNLKKLYAEKIKIAKGNHAPDFKAYDVTGKEIRLSDFKGKIVYVDIWATWCGPCKREIPYLKNLEKQYHDNKNVVFVSVSIDSDENEDAWKQMIKDKALGGIQLRAQGEFESDIAKSYQVKGIPTFLLISKEGNIISSKAPRPSSGEKIKALINKNI